MTFTTKSLWYHALRHALFPALLHHLRLWQFRSRDFHLGGRSQSRLPAARNDNQAATGQWYITVAGGSEQIAATWMDGEWKDRAILACDIVAIELICKKFRAAKVLQTANENWFRIALIFGRNLRFDPAPPLDWFEASQAKRQWSDVEKVWGTDLVVLSILILAFWGLNMLWRHHFAMFFQAMGNGCYESNRKDAIGGHSLSELRHLDPTGQDSQDIGDLSGFSNMGIPQLDLNSGSSWICTRSLAASTWITWIASPMDISAKGLMDSAV